MTLPLALCLAGGLWVLGLWHVNRIEFQSRWIWVVLLLLGFGLRLVAFQFPAYAEIDFYRYFWDGRQTLNGFNPYSEPVVSYLQSAERAAFARLPENQVLVDGIRHDTKLLSTIYAPVAVGIFAFLDWMPGPPPFAYAASFFGAEIASLLILKAFADRQTLAFGIWALALNPLLILVTYNGLHFDIWTLPLILGWGLMIRDGRVLPALCFLLAAISLRHWAVFLLPLTLMHLSTWRDRWIAGTLIVLCLFVLFWPQISTYRLPHSGLRIYGSLWEMNDALFLGSKALMGERWARAFAVLVPFFLAIALPFSRFKNAPFGVGMVLIAMLLLLSPTFFPWYWLWMLPLLILARSSLALILAGLAAFLPLYYLRFWLEEREMAAFFDERIVWIEFGPVLAALLVWGLYHVHRADHSRPQ